MMEKNFLNLKECLKKEVMVSAKPFSWFKNIHKALKCPDRRFCFWWRTASYLYDTDKKYFISLAERINRKISLRYGCEIELGAIIGPGITFAHYNGIVISRAAIIGKNFHIRQNTTIGVVTGVGSEIIIGDNVEVGANSCIIGDNLHIGDNVTIGAMTFVNKDIPSNSIIFTEKFNRVYLKKKVSI